MGGSLPLEVVFIANKFKYWFCPFRLSLKFDKDPSTGYKDISNSKHPQWVGGWVGGVGWVGSRQIIMPLSGPILQAETCQRFSAELRFQDRAECGNSRGRKLSCYDKIPNGKAQI
jgi:hypothetical protein